MDTMYRSDMDTMFLTNDLLRWQDQAGGGTKEGFPVRSFNTAAGEQGLATRPYVLSVIVPQKEDAEITAMMDFSPKRIAEQLYCGCVTADQMMVRQFGAESRSGSCREKFRPKSTNKKTTAEPEYFAPEVCAAPARNVAENAPKPNGSGPTGNRN